ncbi:uncharacterized protein JCM6883_004734 [Sporobolomyces salmoneus]|uniref:uncharacterized protein n=1 Tax=Sporobolomyces salmoneus TaxID=183962 RepID=UPI00316B0961
MARQGRQPQQLSTSTKPSKAKPTRKGGNKKKAATNSEPTDLDVYSFSSSTKRPRGDVDPAAKASFQSDKGKNKKGKGKARQRGEEESGDEDEESAEEDDSEDEDLDSESEGFKVKGNGIIEFTGMKPAGLKMGMGSDEEGGFGSDDDEDINSDFSDEMSDEAPRKKKQSQSNKKSLPSTEIDLDEEEVDSGDEDGDGFMDMSEMMDRNGEEDSDEDGSGSDEDIASDADSMDQDQDDEEAGALDKLDDFVSGLETSKKRKAGDRNDDESGKKKKRVILKERTEAYPEGEFVAVGADSASDNRVQLEDLLSSFADSKNPRLANLRKTLKPLAATAESNLATPTGSTSALKRAGPISAPLPARLQDKVDREAAFEKTKEETDKWNETVKRMKGESGVNVSGARHERLVLPLIDPTHDAKRAPNSNELNAKFQPTNDLEASIQALLSAGQMQQTDLDREEQAQLATLDPADLAARRAELRRQRDLMYRAERKAKRVAKIKSKAYRRIHRKGKDKDGPQLSLEDLEELDRIDGGDRFAEERARLEVLRAKERATLKHSSKGGRWAKKVDGLDGLEDERNKSIRDMVERRDQLRKKIAGIEDGDEDDEFAPSGSEEEYGSGDDADFDSIRQTAFDELAAIDAKEAAAAKNDPKLKGVMNMKFMKDARTRASREVEQDADELRRKLEQMDQAAEREQDDEPIALAQQVQGNLGRMVFGPSSTLSQTAVTDVEPAPSKASTTTKISSISIDSPSSSSRPSTSRARPSLSNPGSSKTNEEENPWLALADQGDGAKLSRKNNKASFGKDSLSVAEKVADKAARARSKQTDSRQAERDDAEVELDLSAGLVSSGSKKKREKAPQVGGAVARPAESMEAEADDSDAQSDDEINAQRGKGPTAFKQRELVKEAFANDDVVADFAEEKRREIERDAPREEDNTLPGWGSWAGKGAKKNKNQKKKFVKKIAGIDASDRKDAGLNHVIINEKKDKKASKYMLKDLPFPYTSAAQLEHKLRTPMGPEWSTSTILRDQTIPSVLVKPGATVRPVSRRT